VVERLLPQLESARAIFLDWDGCLVEGHALKEGALQLLARFTDKCFILSNNSTNLPTQFSQFLRNRGVVIPEERIFLAGHRTIDLAVARYSSDRVFVIGGQTLTRYGRRRGLTIVVKGEAETVLLLRDVRFSYAKLDAAANLIRRGARLIVANLDRTHPRGKEVTPETGAIYAALAACADLNRAEVLVVGKPERLLFDLALSAAGAAAGDVVMIGDNPLTDIAGATARGIHGVLLNEPEGCSLAAIMQEHDSPLEATVG
jgi:HAD superfamily hydrolase (TIGR01450 family)